jgi:hypothetical protein
MSMGLILSGALANAEGLVDAWAELKVHFKFCSPILMLIRIVVYLAYFEVQSKSIAYVIQGFSSGPHSHILANALRKPCTNHHYCIIHRPRMQRKPHPASVQQGNKIPQELSEHMDSLSDVQDMVEGANRLWPGLALRLSC